MGAYVSVLRIEDTDVVRLSQQQDNYLYESLVLSFPCEIYKEDRFVLVLHGYFDESGTHSNSKAISVAGYLATSDQWQKFDVEWKQAMEDFELEFFHMTDFVARRAPYDKWDDDQRRERLSRLIELINGNVFAGIGFALPMSEYYKAFSKRAKEYCGGAYGLAATVCFMDAAMAVKDEHPKARIAYIFEQGVKGRGQVMKIFDHACDDPKLRDDRRLLSLKYENKRDFRPLQAADILAYELYRHLPIQIGESQQSPRLSVLNSLTKCPRNYWKTFDEETMCKFARVIDAAAQHYGSKGPRTRKRWS